MCSPHRRITPSIGPSTTVKNPGPYRAPLYEFCLTPLSGRGNVSGKRGNSPGTNQGFQAGIIEAVCSNVTAAPARNTPASAGSGFDPQAQTPWRAKFHRHATRRRRSRRMPPKSGHNHTITGLTSGINYTILWTRTTYSYSSGNKPPPFTPSTAVGNPGKPGLL